MWALVSASGHDKGFINPQRKQMKRINLTLITALMLAWTTSPLIAASNPLETQILKLQPQADKNGDGKLSQAEEAALMKMILKRFPRADSDGDGVVEALSEVVITAGRDITFGAYVKAGHLIEANAGTAGNG